MNPVHWLIDTILELYIWVIIASVILSWLVAFNVINTRNTFVHQLRSTGRCRWRARRKS